MSHFTGLKELQNRPHKSGHDISAKNCFTAKVGELLPVWTDFAIPNSTYRFKLEYFTRTRPVQTSAYTRIREYFDFFAVPCDLIWKSFDSAVIQMGEKAPIQSKDLLTNLSVKGDLPYCTINDFSQALWQCVYKNFNCHMALCTERRRSRQECDPYHACQLEFFFPGKRIIKDVTHQYAEKGHTDQDQENQ